jgi:hypothetical protein
MYIVSEYLNAIRTEARRHKVSQRKKANVLWLLKISNLKKGIHLSFALK